MIKFFDCGGYGDVEWGSTYTHIHSRTMEKIAGFVPEELVGFIGSVKPRPEGRYVLLNALGAYERWGHNSNGDAFCEWSLKGDAPPSDVNDIIRRDVPKVIPDFCVPPTRTYGGPTFVTNAKVYQNHINKDPTIACGDVVAQAYNPQMHRVELIVFVYTARVPDIVRMIDENVPVPWSMGCRLKYDRCSICGKISRNRLEYCEHLRTQLRQYLPDGRKVFSYNDFPVFFDISKVNIPADRSAWLLQKVASVEAPVAEKNATIEKHEPAVSQDSLGSTPINPKLVSFVLAQHDYSESTEVDPQLMELKNKHSLPEILKAMLCLGMLPNQKELSVLTDNNPENVPNKLDFVNPNRKLIIALSTRVPERSLIDPHFSKRAIKMSNRKIEKIAGNSVFTKFAQLLETLDYSALTRTMETNPSVRLALDESAIETSLFKISSDKKAASWLPFVIVCSQISRRSNSC